MDEGTSSSLISQRTRRNSLESESRKFAPEESLEFDAGVPELREAAHPPRRVRWQRTLESRFPRCGRAVRYLRGPQPKVELPSFIPFLEQKVDIKSVHLDLRLESAFIRRTRSVTRLWLFVLLAAAYIISLAFLSRAQSFLTPTDAFAACTTALWSKDAGCGLDGDSCLPFSNTTYDIRCPAQCSSVILANPRTIGDEQVVYKPLIVGGGDANRTYRGDSFVCAAAVHAGAITDSKGGCFSIELTGDYFGFLGSTSHSLTSIGFPSIFPLSFRFLPVTSLTHCTDFRTPVLVFNAIVTALLFLLLRPKPIVIYWSLVCIGFWHVTLFSQPRSQPPVISDGFGSFLPALFVAYAFWRLAFRFVLPIFALLAPLEGTLLYLFPFWIGVLNNLTFDRIPIDRLLPSDIAARPGGLIAVIFVVLAVLVLGINQARIFRKTGWLPHYAAWYGAGGAVVLVLALLPGLQFRLHHYILAMALMPCTAFPTRVSAVCQALLLGLFLNGVAAWGFDSILQTDAELRRDAPLGSTLPTFLTNSSLYNASLPLQNQTLSWAPLSDGWDGYALLVDDVERYLGTALNFTLVGLREGIPHFFRLAFTNAGEIGDFTMPATIWPNGSFSDPLPGPS